MGLLYIMIYLIYKQIPSGDPKIKIKEETGIVYIISHMSTIYMTKVIKLNKKNKSVKLHLSLPYIKI
jgi:hypothetical protein